jgi:ribosomal protein S18 acetylase RimI-like enzyme
MSTTNGATPTSVHIVEAGVSDIPRLAPLFDAYRQFYEQAPDLQGAEAYLTSRLERHESVIFLAEATIPTSALPSPAGFTQLYPSFSSVSMCPHWILNDLFVSPEFRRLGIGAALLERARHFAVGTGAKSIVLETAVTNKAAQALYESLSWKRDELFYTYELEL